MTPTRIPSVTRTRSQLPATLTTHFPPGSFPTLTIPTVILARTLIRTSASTIPVARTMSTRKMSSAPARVRPRRAFLTDVPVPADVYPLIAIIATVCSGRNFMLGKHMDHLRWMPKHEGVRFQLAL